MTIFDLMTTEALQVFWEELAEDRTPNDLLQYFPNAKKSGLDLKWIKGKSGIPTVLRSSAFDVHVIPRPRNSFDQLATEMPFFKESMVINEELRQQFLMLMSSNNQTLIDTVLNRIFNDTIELLIAAASTRERMRALLLTTGIIAFANNGQAFYYDYGMADEQKRNAAVVWTDTANADPIADFQDAIDYIEQETGSTPATALMNQYTVRLLRSIDSVKNAIFIVNSFVNATNILTDDVVNNYFEATVGVSIRVLKKRFTDENGVVQPYFPNGIVTLVPDGALGNTWFGTTPEEADLQSAPNIATVSIVDTGVAITTMKQADPVNVETKVSQICLPSFERVDEVVILDVLNAA